MSDQKNILMLYKDSSSIPDQIIDEARAKAPAGYNLMVCDRHTAADERKQMVKSADYLVAYSVPFEDFEEIETLRLVQLLSAGFDSIDVPRFKTLGIPVANNGSVNSSTVAEHAVLLMLSVLKRLPVHHQSLQQGDWLGHRLALQLRDIRSKRVGIVGFGHIGREVARNLSGFRPELVYYDPYPASKEVEHELNIERVEFEELVRTSDIISIHLPLFEKTRGLISTKEFEQMKDTAIIINTSRGPVIDEEALVAALDSGLIGGAGLDVYGAEPLEANSRLLGRDNVVTTPHIAGTSVDNWERRLDFCYANIERVDRGEEPLALVG